MARSYRPVRDFPSKSNPGKSYTVSMDEEGNLSCNCPAWTFKKGDERTCKHVQAVEADGGASQPAPAPMPEPPTPREKGGTLADLFERINREG